MVEAEIVPVNMLESLQQETKELIAIFTTVVKKVKSKDDGRRIREEGPAREVDETELLEYSEEEDAKPRKDETGCRY